VVSQAALYDCKNLTMALLHTIVFDFNFKSETGLLGGIWMSLFDTEEAHAVMLAHPA
jgi:hypothetical protein